MGKEVKTDEHKLTVEEALSLLAPHIEKRKKRVHSYVSAGPALLGCDMDLTSVKKELKTSEDIRLSGPNMRGMNHGIAFFDKKFGYTFLETDKEKIDIIHKERGL